MYSLEYAIIVESMNKITIIETFLALIYIVSVLFKFSIVGFISFSLFFFFFILLMRRKKSLTKLLQRVIDENETKIKKHIGDKQVDYKSFIKFNKKNISYTSVAQEIKNRKSKNETVYNDMFVKLISKNYKNEYLSKRK